MKRGQTVALNALQPPGVSLCLLVNTTLDSGTAREARVALPSGQLLQHGALAWGGR